MTNPRDMPSSEMTLRDYFAAKFVIYFLNRMPSQGVDNVRSIRQIYGDASLQAYELADVMLEARVR